MKQSQPISWEEYQRVLDCLRADKRWRDLLLWGLAGHTAYRVSDYTTLRWSDLLGTNTLSIQEKKHMWMNKASRKVRIGKSLRALIDECQPHLNPYQVGTWYVFRPASAKVLPGDKMHEGQRPPLTRFGVQYILKTLAREYKVPGADAVCAHSLRKTFARHVYEKEGSSHRALSLVQKLLGHSNSDTTLTYIGITDEVIHNVYENL